MTFSLTMRANTLVSCFESLVNQVAGEVGKRLGIKDKSQGGEKGKLKAHIPDRKRIDEQP